MKKILLTLLLSLVAFSAYTQTELRQGDLIFTLYQPDDGVPYAEVTGNSLSQKTDLIIPSKVSYGGIDYIVTSIGNRAFVNCEHLVSVEIPTSVTSIGMDAFWGCKSLTSVEIPSSVTIIGRSAFSKCTSLTSVEIPSSITAIGKSVFHDCASLASVEIPSSVTTIVQEAFKGCSSLTSVEIPSSVTYIGQEAFKNCTSLTSVEIPSYVIAIAPEAFRGCCNIKEVNYNTKEPIEAVKNVFSDEVYANATLNVAVGGLENAKRTRPWMYFNDIREIEFSGVDSPVAESCSDGPVAIYDTNGIYVGDSERSLAPGMYVVRKGDKARLVYVK